MLLGFLNLCCGPLFWNAAKRPPLMLGRLLCIYMLTLCSVFCFSVSNRRQRNGFCCGQKSPFTASPPPLFTLTYVPKMSHSIKTSFHGGACVTICVSLHYRCIFAEYRKKQCFYSTKKWFSTKDNRPWLDCLWCASDRKDGIQAHYELFISNYSYQCLTHWGPFHILILKVGGDRNRILLYDACNLSCPNRVSIKDPYCTLSILQKKLQSEPDKKMSSKCSVMWWRHI